MTDRPARKYRSTDKATHPWNYMHASESNKPHEIQIKKESENATRSDRITGKNHT